MQKNDYMNFHLIVNRVAEYQDDQFITVVADAPVSRFAMPFGLFGGNRPWREQLEQFDEPGVRLVRDAEGYYRLGQLDAQGSLTEQQLKQLGRVLFQFLFPFGSTAYDLLGQSCQCANREGAYLRIRLDLDNALSNFPWEALNSPRSGKWAAAINGARKVIVRYLGDIHDSVHLKEGDPSFRQKPCIIVVKADPKTCRDADITESFYKEKEVVGGVLRKLDNYRFEFIEGKNTLTQLQQRVEDLKAAGSPVIGLHFMGHGGVDDNGGFLAGENEYSEESRIYEEDLRDALDRANSIKWVILNACNTAEEPIGCPLAGLATSMAVLKNVPTVIAYKRPVDTEKAIAVTKAFYEYVLHDNLSIDDAIRSVQTMHKNPGGLVILERSVAGKTQDLIWRGEGEATPPPRPAGDAAESAAKHAARAAEPASGARPVGVATETAGAGRLRMPAAVRADGAAAGADSAEYERMVVVAAGTFKKGLSTQQVEHLLRRFKEHGLPLDLDSARENLSADPDEEVYLDEFYIDLAPVTNVQFRRFVEATRYKTDAERAGDPRNWTVNGSPLMEHHPVIYVSYADAEAYADWAGKKLPTADQWKKACRGPNGRIYAWGDEFDEMKCNTAESCRGWETTPVDKFKNGASPYGCLDMIGNVEEWTQTTDENDRKIILGGSWAMSCEVYGLPVLHRLASPGLYSNDLGFRCVRDHPGQ